MVVQRTKFLNEIAVEALDFLLQGKARLALIFTCFGLSVSLFISVVFLFLKWGKQHTRTVAVGSKQDRLGSKVKSDLHYSLLALHWRLVLRSCGAAALPKFLQKMSEIFDIKQKIKKKKLWLIFL